MEEQKITLVKVKNLFDRYDREIITVPYEGNSLLEVRNEFFPQEIEVVTSVNGQVVPTEHLPSSFLRGGDYVTFIPSIQGGGNAWRIIATLVVAILATIAAVFTYGATAPEAGAAWGAFFAALAGTAVSLLGGMLVNAIFPIATPTLKSIDMQEFNSSSTFSWSPQTAQQAGLPIPRYYGESRAYGNIISTYIETLNDRDNYLNILLGLSMGPVKEISDFQLNNQVISNFYGVTIYDRKGWLTNVSGKQELVPNFNSTKTEYSVSRKVMYGETGQVLYTTIGDTFDGLEVSVTFPRGVGRYNDQGGIDYHTIDYRIEARLHGSSADWILLTSHIDQEPYVVAEGYWSLGFWIRDGYGDAGGGADGGGDGGDGDGGGGCGGSCG